MGEFTPAQAKWIEDNGGVPQAPHCDEAVLHGPEDGCPYCNEHPDWQKLRMLWRIAFTGHEPRDPLSEVACPSDQRRGGTGAAHVWPGNRPEGYHPMWG